MHKFFCRSQDILGDKIVIADKEQVHHIKNVLRLKPGKKAGAFDEKGNEYNCEIREVKDEVSFKIKNIVLPGKSGQKIRLTVACAIPKKAKLGEIIDKLVQLGVERIIPLKTERVIVKLDGEQEVLRLARWKKIALSASKQSKRNDLAVIEQVQSLQEVISRSSGFSLKLIPHLEGARESLKAILDKSAGEAPANILLLIGPEGDFSQKEVHLAVSSGFIPVSLGDLVLRVDTAAIAAAAFIRLYAYN